MEPCVLTTVSPLLLPWLLQWPKKFYEDSGYTSNYSYNIDIADTSQSQFDCWASSHFLNQAKEIQASQWLVCIGRHPVMHQICISTLLLVVQPRRFVSAALLHTTCAESCPRRWTCRKTPLLKGVCHQLTTTTQCVSLWSRMILPTMPGHGSSLFAYSWVCSTTIHLLSAALYAYSCMSTNNFNSYNTLYSISQEKEWKHRIQNVVSKNLMCWMRWSWMLVHAGWVRVVHLGGMNGEH